MRGSRSWRSGSRGWSGWSPGTRGTPRCRRAPMTCRGRSRRSAGRARRREAQAGQAARRAGRVPGVERSPGRYDPAFPGGQLRRAALTWPGPSDLGVRYSHQVTDLPEARAQTIQHDRHEVRCACGRMHVADAPPEAAGAPGTVTYGLNFQAWCVFLMVMHHVPVERCADIIESMSGTRPSDGWVHALLARAAKAVAAASKAIRALIILARVICGDETPVRAGPGPEDPEEVPAGRLHEPAHLLLPRRPGPALLQGLRLQRPARHRHRPRPVPELRLLRRASATSCAPSTLLRDLEDAAQSYPDAIWPGQIAEALRGLIHAANVARDQGLAAVPAEMTAEHLTAVPPRRRRRAVARSAASPAQRASSRPPAACWNACGTAKPTCCGS